MRADAQRDGYPAEYRWRPPLNAAKLADAHCSSVRSNGANYIRTQDLNTK